MAYRWMLPTSARWIAISERARDLERASGAVAGDDIARAADAPAAAAALGGDFARGSRIAWGALALVLWAGASAAAALVPMGFTETLERERAVAWAVSATGLAFAGALGVASAYLLLKAARSGRALTRALSFWVRLPYRRGEAARSFARGYVIARAIWREPALAARAWTGGITAGLAALGAGAAIHGMGDGSPALAVFGLVLCAGMLPVTVGLYRGVYRVGMAYSEADPAWIAVRAWFTGARGRGRAISPRDAEDPAAP